MDGVSFGIFGNRVVCDDGWMATAQHTLPWRRDVAPGNRDKDSWELQSLDED
jgi:arylsulfatase